MCLHLHENACPAAHASPKIFCPNTAAQGAPGPHQNQMSVVHGHAVRAALPDSCRRSGRRVGALNLIKIAVQEWDSSPKQEYVVGL